MNGFNEAEDLESVPGESLCFSISEESTKPFLKWAGGKTQLLPELSKYIPGTYNKYIEPFIGGGAFYFYLNPAKAIIADLNEDLVITYKCVQTKVEEVIAELKRYKNEESFYYQIRALDAAGLSDTQRAARLIYLNKTCFNGLYRVNKKGQYNVPYGKRNTDFINEEGLRRAGAFLQSAAILHKDYKHVLLNYATEGDFVFLDPPYYPVGKFSDFKRYTKEFFYHEDQVILKNEFDMLVDKGCSVVLTNSDHPFIRDLYKSYKIEIINTKRLISSNPNTRTGKDIIVIGGMNK